MKTKTIIISAVSVATVGVTAHSCVALATSAVGVTIIKNILLGGITKGLGIFKSKDAFLQNDLISKALPQQLQDINSILGKIAPNLVAKEKDYIAQAAAYTVTISEPILKNAVNSLTTEDVTRIAQGGSGMATQILKEKTQSQLIAAISPKVDEKLNEFGIVKSINTALKGNNLLSSILGGSSNAATTSISNLASEQLVNGLFNIVEDYEKQNSQQILNALGK
ncbi:MAG: DUF4197 family protein [Bergeyella sp.]